MGIFSKILGVFSGKEAVPPGPEAYKIQIVIEENEPDDEFYLTEPEPDIAFSDPPITEEAKYQSAGGDLWGITFAIEYSNAKNEKSVRRITLRDIKVHSAKMPLIQAHCHERDGPRSFRFDRIECVIDEYGEVFDKTNYFEDELQFPITSYLPDESDISLPAKGATDKIDKPGVRQRKVCRDELRVLVALARSDGEYHPEEMKVVLEYVISECGLASVAVAEEDKRALERYLKSQRPDGKVLSACLNRLEQREGDKQNRFLDAAERVVMADGVEHPEEMRVFGEIRSAIG